MTEAVYTALAIAYQCPDCPKDANYQGITLNRAAVVEALEKGEDIRIMGGQCGHVTSMDPVGRENLRKRLADGTL